MIPIPKDNDFEFVEAKISYTFAKKSIKLPDDTEYTFNLLDGVNCTNSFSNTNMDLNTIYEPSTSSGLSTSLDSYTNLDSSTSLDANNLPN